MKSTDQTMWFIGGVALLTFLWWRQQKMVKGDAAFLKDVYAGIPTTKP